MDDVALTHLICALLGRVPGWHYDPDPDAEPYPAGSVGIFYGAVQPRPVRAIGVRVYWSSDDELHVRRAQLTIRGGEYDPSGADELAGVVFAVLHGLSRVGGISDARRISHGSLGADNTGRESRSDNYQFILDNPEAIRYE